MLTNNVYYLKYRSFERDFDKDFMIPAYKESLLLERASGYFTLRSLMLSMEGIIDFAEREGIINLVCSPYLSNDDIALIEASQALTQDSVSHILLKEVVKETSYNENELDKLDVICNMIAEGQLNIKIAYLPQGIYHEKFGIFTDEIGNKVYFNGSANETAHAKLNNMESFQVSLSWAGSEKLIQEESQYFDSIWENRHGSLKVIDFPEAVRERLFENYKRSDTLQDALRHLRGEKTGCKKLYDYQEKAIDEFFLHNGRHFYEMATGTGKTFTAVKTIEELKRRSKEPLFVVICVPQIDLQVQWQAALVEEGFDGITLFGGVAKDTENAITHAVITNAMGMEDVICISTYDTFFAKAARRLSNVDNIFLIIDEAHNLNPNQIKQLPPKTLYRLGLSATIQRFSARETKAIVDFFCEDGVLPFYYGIEDAIHRGFLSHYEYHPVFIQLTTDEFDSYQRRTLAIAAEMNKDDSERDEELLNRLLNERSLIVKKAANKISMLASMAKDGYNFVNCVVYCGQGKMDEEPIIDQVTETLYHTGLSVHTFTSHTEDRPRVLKEFESGYFDVLVAIKCFDEGVDVPKLDKIYIMASDSAIRQTVQRRGRVLRMCKATGKTMAHIYDMVAQPPAGIVYDTGARSLIINEFRRYREYARLADNKEKLKEIAEKYYNEYDITDEDFAHENN